MKEKCKQLKKKITEKTRGPKEFLRAGTVGGIVLSVLVSTLCLWGNVFAEFFSLPLAVSFVITVVAILLFAELLFLLLKLLFGCGKHAKIYWFVSFAFILISNLIGNQAHALLAAIAMSLLVSLAVSTLGTCIWAFIKTKRFRQIYGYVVTAFSVVVIGAFGIFWAKDDFGKSRIDFYLEKAPEYSSQEIPGFAQYLENGTNEVEYLSYAPEKADIITSSFDTTQIVEREGTMDAMLDLCSPYDATKAPIAGGIWYPKELTNCPVLFIVHGAHSAKTESYLGYDYLGEYLASNGYVVVSVDENIVNSLNMGNDMRAILLLENMKAILELNEKQDSPLFHKMNAEQLAIAGHSRGGEMVATAYLFNNLDCYPENGNVAFQYHFPISAIIAIAPTVDQYMPANHAVQIKDVNYLLLHGSNDQDVSMMQGEKQYKNVDFSDNTGKYCKASVYIMGANHGQFNTRWGRYDLSAGVNGYLNTNHFIEASEQQLIAKAYIRTFLDASLQSKDTYKDLLIDNRGYQKQLPQTVYVTNYMDSSCVQLCSFDENTNLKIGNAKDIQVDCKGMKEWTVHSDHLGLVPQEENYVLDCTWEKGEAPDVQVKMPPMDLSRGYLSFRIADMREDIAEDNEGINYTVRLTDASGNTISSKCPRYIYPSLGLQLYKQDVLMNSYEYKHQMQMVMLSKETFDQAESFDFTTISEISFKFDGDMDGEIILDAICYQNLVRLNENIR